MPRFEPHPDRRPALVTGASSGHGDIVLVTSDVVVRPRTRMAAYVTAKTGLEGLGRALQMELEGTGVRVGVIRPGPSSTEQGSTWSEETVVEIVDDWTRWGHMRHDGALRPQDVAAAVLTMVATPKGTHLTLVEVQPEAPVRPDRRI
jgi:NADP-dependent 3-hydroxy acid dehydrogenase YdfG